ncbi:MAG TPA: HNH endonuclease [Firmicutes bacterium]|jgi:putative restriction endonuclease|nr:HNH endonuclease [Bacillota bacterium]
MAISGMYGGDLVMMQEAQIRLAIFTWLEDQSMLFDDILPWSLLQHGFSYRGQQISLVGQQGIWKPRVFKSIPLSIRTSPKGPYNDGLTDDGLLHYKYRGTDPNHWENAGLRQAGVEGVPLVYFHALSPGKYVAAWPVFIIGEDRANLAFTVAVDDKQHIQSDQLVSEEADVHRRRYITASFRVRLHQKVFRTRVLEAYRSQCAFCQLRHAELLDAAHIIPDSDPEGEPIVSNGLSLCKIHHAAYDRHFIGVSPDYQIIVRDDLLHEIDGPMLRHGIQEIHNKRLILPKKQVEKPNRDRLALRFEQFRKAM